MTKLQGKPFALIGVSRGDPPKVKKATQKNDLNWRSFADDESITAAWNFPSTPAYYVIDHKGIIRQKWIGGTPGPKALDAKIEKLIKEAEEGRDK